MKTVIMAGGKGTRIAEMFPGVPKPLIPIMSSGGEKKPVLQWEIESLRDQGFNEIILTVGYMADKIMDYFGDGNRFGVCIDYFVEEVPLGNAGALFKLDLNDDFLLLNADAVFDVDFNRMREFHKERHSLATLFTHPNSHPYDSGIVIPSEDGSVEDWLTKEENRPMYYKNCVNAGLHILSPEVLIRSGIDSMTIGKKDSNGNIIKVDLDRQLLKPLCSTHTMFSYSSPEYVKDMGTPERFRQVSNDFSSGLVQARNLKNKQRCIFLDRDGTINKYVGFLRNVEEFELLPGVTDAIKLINSSGYLCIIVTNQPVVARGEVTVAQLQEIHNKLETLLGNEGAYIDDLYYCPHHPHKGYDGEILELKIDCDCRKPKPGMLLKAARDYNIDLLNSWMIGDSEIDIEAGKNAGCHTALISSIAKKVDCTDLTAPTLLKAVKEVLKKNI